MSTTLKPAQLAYVETLVGLKEVGSTGTHPTIQKWARDLGIAYKNEAWCALTVCHVLEKVGYDSPRTLWAKDFVRYGRNLGRRLIVGGIAVFHRGENNEFGHVGIIKSVAPDGQSFQLISGNDANSVRESTRRVDGRFICCVVPNALPKMVNPNTYATDLNAITSPRPPREIKLEPAPAPAPTPTAPAPTPPAPAPAPPAPVETDAETEKRLAAKGSRTIGSALRILAAIRAAIASFVALVMGMGGLELAEWFVGVGSKIKGVIDTAKPVLSFIFSQWSIVAVVILGIVAYEALKIIAARVDDDKTGAHTGVDRK